MKYYVLVSFCLAAVAALPLDVIQDDEGQDYLLVPIHRERRQLKWGADQDGYNVAQKGTVYNNGNHKVDGTIDASKAWGSHGVKPDSFGGRVDYTHTPSRSTAFVGANKTPGYGTDVAAGGKYNFAHGKNWNADVSGQYGRHYGGPGGTGKPEVGASLTVKRTF